MLSLKVGLAMTMSAVVIVTKNVYPIPGCIFAIYIPRKIRDRAFERCGEPRLGPSARCGERAGGPSVALRTSSTLRAKLKGEQVLMLKR